MKMPKHNLKLIIFILVMIFLESIFLTIKLKPDDYDLSNVEYEEVQAKVINTKTREINSTKYNKRKYYDVTLEYDNQQYVWTTNLYDPKMMNGISYDFILCDGRMYRTMQDLQSNLNVTNSPIAFRISVILIVVSLAGLLVCVAYLFARSRHP